MWGDGYWAVLAQSVARVDIAQAGIEFVRNWPREEVVQLERELVHEAGSERFDRTGLEVRRVQEFREERDVIFFERGVWEGRGLRTGVRLELGQRRGLVSRISTVWLYFRDAI